MILVYTLPFICVKIHFNVIPNLCECRTCWTRHYLQKTPWPYQPLQLSSAAEYPWPACWYLYQLGCASDGYLQLISAASVPHTSIAGSTHIWRFCSQKTVLLCVNVHRTYIKCKCTFCSRHSFTGFSFKLLPQADHLPLFLYGQKHDGCCLTVHDMQIM